MPVVVGAWLCGLQDNDKLVARGVQESFDKVFSTAEKRDGVWKAFQGSILEYCRDAILKETPQTLSDERITSLDDAQAKCSRVIGTAILTVAHAMEALSKAEIQKEKDRYSELLGAKALWKLASTPDAFVRRSLFRLLRISLSQMNDLIEYSLVSTYILQEGLHADQSGSSNELARTLMQLTQIQPLVWTQYYSGKGKKSPSSRFASFLRKGSQGAPAEFWSNLSALLHDVPMEALEPPSGERAHQTRLSVLTALLEGVSRKEEQRPSQTQAWKAYLQLAARLLSSYGSDEKASSNLSREHLLPLIAQHLRPSPDTSEWNITGNQLEICTLAIMIVLRVSIDDVRLTVEGLSASLVNDLQVSLPEQSKSYEQSQRDTISKAQRWYTLQANLLKVNRSAELRELLSQTSAKEIESAISVIKNRNGKPYCAAATIELAVRFVPEITTENNDTAKTLLAFAQKDVPLLMTSPSSPYLLQLLGSLSSSEGIGNVYHACLKALIHAPKSPGRSHALETLMSSSWPKDQNASESLASIAKDSLREVLTRFQDDSWPLVAGALKNQSAPVSLTDELLTTLTESLSADSQTKIGLAGFEIIVQHNAKAFQNYMTSSNGSTLLSRLLYLSQKHDADVEEEDIVSRAAKLKISADTLISSDQYSSVATDSMIAIIRNGALDTGPTALTVDSLVGQARKLMDDSEDDWSVMLRKLLPDDLVLESALDSYLKQVPNHTLALTNSLGGAVYLVETDATGQKAEIGFDRDGFSIAFRLASYTIGLLKTPNVAEELSDQERASYFHFVVLYSELLEDHLAVNHKQSMWHNSEDLVDREILHVVKSQQNDILELRSAKNGALDRSLPMLDKLYEEAAGHSVLSYYNARAYTTSMRNSRMDHRYSDQEIALTNMRKSEDVVRDAAILTYIEPSRASLKLCNELLSDLAGKPLETDPAYALQRLVLLSRLISVYDGNLEDIPQQRLAFFVKHVVASLRSGITEHSTLSEALKVLSSILLAIKDLYGDFWEDIVHFCTFTLESTSHIPSLYNCLKLCSMLQRLAREASNDDIEEVWAAQESTFANALVALLDSSYESDVVQDEPRKMVNNMIGLQLPEIAGKASADRFNLYRPLGSPSPSLQQAAYGVLQQKVSSEQEEVSMEAALSQDYVAKLPEELIEIIRHAPEPIDHLSLRNTPELPASLTRYLLGWKLVYDHWTKASYKVQSDYVSQIKETNTLKDFLSFTTELLIHRRGSKSIVKASEYDVLAYQLNRSDTQERDLYWLLSHLYYLSLVHLPALVKAWWRSFCPRYLERQVEEWTEKYISPAVIAAELSTVSAWDPNPDDTELEIRVNPRSREVTASYPIDEQSMSIRIILPPTYPLHAVAVTTGQRVGIDEKKWAAWLNTSNIAINFSSSSQGLGCIIDGLVAWRKNVVGKLKGQSECAICYSVVSADRQLPTKRCGTCKHMFHGSCLFRWFKSSSSSSCPLCRNAFNYDGRR